MKKLLIPFLALAALTGSAADYAMKPGDDARTVRDRIRADRASGKIAADEKVTVTLAPGIYHFDRTLELDEKDSGTEAGPVVWRAEKRGTVRVFGGRAIPRSAFAPVADAATRERLDAAVRDKVLVCDAAPYLVKAAETWPNLVSGIAPGPWLYHNGDSMPLARWPNAAADGGFFGYTNVVEKGSKTVPGAFEFPGDRAARWRLEDGVWLMGYWIYDWHSETLKLGSYDAKTHVARMAGGSTYGLGKGQSWPFPIRRFYALNLLEELDAPGEWYLDRKGKRLYWYPRPAAEGRTDEIVLAQALTPFVKMVRTAFVEFENLSFEYSHGATSVAMSEAVRCAVKGCDFFNHSGCAVSVGGRENRLAGLSIRNVGGTAVVLSGGSSRDLLPANNAMYKCIVDGYAMYQRTMAAGAVVYGCGNAIRNCVFRNAPYIAISYSGNEHLIADNEFDHVVQEAGDSGCIYSGHNASWLGTLIFGNYIHDLAKTPEESNARNGIYFDDCDWGDDVIGNVFVHSGRAIFFGGGKLHGAYNNLVKDSLIGVHCDSRGRGWRVGWRGSFGWDQKGRSFARYRMSEAGADPHYAPWHVVYPQLEEAMDDHPELPGMNEVKGNVICGCKTPFGYDGWAQKVMGKESPGNTVIPAGAAAPDKAPQPIRLLDAAKGRFESADGGTLLKVALDESARLSWSLDVGGRHLVARSPLGVTVGTCDYGRRVVPCSAEVVTNIDAAAFAKVTKRQLNSPQGFARNMTTNMPAVAGLRGWKIPVKCLISGETVAALEVCVWNGGGATRWTVPGQGERKVYGENTCFLGDVTVSTVCEWGRPEGYPEHMATPRGKGFGITFPEYPRGWKHVGDLVTPWRGAVAAE